MMINMCAERIYRSVKRIRAKRKVLGLCVECGKDSSPFVRCVECRAKANKYGKRNRDKRAKLGLCKTCGKNKPKEGCLNCVECIGLANERSIKKRINNKLTLVRRLGSKCSKCGYCKNYSALDFHERNGKNEDLRLTKRGKATNSVNLARLIKLSDSELKEQIELLCSNCHREHHHPDCTL